MDETYIKIKEKWCYLYRLIDKEGQTLRHASRTIKGIETVHILHKQRRSLQSDCVFSTYNELQKLLTAS